MKPEETSENSNNNIFTYAFIGVLLFIAALGFVLAYFPSIITLKLSYTVIAFTLAGASVSLLYKAIKYDKKRLSGI
jgi:hypothetical protein